MNNPPNIPWKFPFGEGGFGEGGFGGSAVPYYLSLITSEYQTSPKFLAWLTACLAILDGIMGCAAVLDPAFDIDSALGPQLDVLGQIIGVSRLVNFTPSDGVSPVLDDYTYRILLKAKVGANQWDGQIGSLWALWQ